MYCDNLLKSARSLLQVTAISMLPSGILASPAHSAEMVFLDYGFIVRSVPTTSLETFAQAYVETNSVAPTRVHLLRSLTNILDAQS